MQAVPDDLGARIRRLRLQKRLTLADLSALSGVPVSTLSKIEKAQVKRVSADSIFKIARGLGVLFDQLVEHRPAVPAASGRLAVTRRQEAEAYSTEAYQYLAHAGTLLKKRMVPLVMRIKTREVPAPQDWSHHDGEEWVFVIKGSIELHTEHYAAVRLGVGDSLYFDSAMRHCFVNRGPGVAEILSVCLADDQLRFAEHRQHAAPAAAEHESETSAVL